MTLKFKQKIMLNPVPMTSNRNFNIQDYENSNIILYFYPKDNTPMCAKESVDFVDNFSEFVRNNTVIFGVSKDTVKSHEEFKDKYNMPFELIADENKYLCDYFQVLKEKSLFGKRYIGIERSTFLIDKDGIISKEWRNVKVSGHVKNILSYISTL